MHRRRIISGIACQSYFTAVYTRNRNFRLYRSSKLGKTTKLQVAKENKFRSSYPEGASKRKKWNDRFNTLMDSLICNVGYAKLYGSVFCMLVHLDVSEQELA